MKTLNLEIEWDKFLKGEFPSDVLKECDPNLEIKIERVNSSTQKISLTTLVPEELTPESLAYTIGYLTAQITTKKLHSL
jgi:hypothetical protein